VKSTKAKSGSVKIKRVEFMEKHLKHYHDSLYFDIDAELESGLLAFCHCYYLRISNPIERKRLLIDVCSEIKRLDVTPEFFLQILEREQVDYLSRMNLDSYIAVNQSLKENIFALIPCIINKIPIFICGKPGCSKTLSIQLIFQHLRGQKSSDPYFKNLEELQMVPFQGTESCTSESILKLFEKAQKYLSTSSEKTVLPVFVFDEIGLAEISPKNPLKVIHSYLEQEKQNIAFIGISNWRLDAAKMNRVLYLARPDPDDDDLGNTAVSIYQSTVDRDSEDEEINKIIRALAEAYSMLKKCNRYTEYSEYYGLRDFYSLIKFVSARISKDHELKQKLEIVKVGIERNFGRAPKVNGAKQMGDYFTNVFKYKQVYDEIPEINPLELVKQNLEDKQARFLLIMSKNDVATYILDQSLPYSMSDRKVMIGSNFEKDKHEEQYGYKCLKECIRYAS